MKRYEAHGSTVLWIMACILGIFLPALTLFVEVTTSMCAEVFFDPIPTVFHLLLVASLPIVNLVTAIWLKQGAPDSSGENLGRMMVANSIVMTVAMFYALIFLPLMPIAIFGVVAWGLGFLPLSPILAVPVTALFRSYLKSVVKLRKCRVRGFAFGFALICSLLLFIELPAAVTHIGLQMAMSKSPSVSNQGIFLLRQMGTPSILFELASGHLAPHVNLPGLVVAFVGRHIRRYEASKIYYRVYGHHWLNAPVGFRSRPWSWRKVTHMRSRRQLNSTADWDAHQGSSAVGRQLSGLSLSSSKMEGSIDPNGAVGYLEWTMIFKNTHYQQREARALIGLPEGGVVSRVTLWVNGQECEAAFASSKKVKAAYQKIVRRRRDPLLVTQHGKDRILAQCFPVPSKGQMKIKIGVTIPLRLPNRSAATFDLPHILQGNFEIPEGSTHLLWLQSKMPMDGNCSQLRPEERKDGRFSLMGNIPNDVFKKKEVTITAIREPDIKLIWCRDDRDQKGNIVYQTFQDRESEACPKGLIIVIDGSVSMKPHLPAIKVALASLPQGLDVTVVRAGQSVEELVLPIQDFGCQGGCDNGQALCWAIEKNRVRVRSSILWLHGPQPINFSSGVTSLLTRANMPIYHLQLVPGSNVVVDELEGAGLLTQVESHGDLVADLQRLFNRWQGKERILAGVRQLKAFSTGSDAIEVAHETSDHLVRLWARDEVERLVVSGDPAQKDNAIELAARWQIVTSISGAVVLESAAQYKEAGLEPVKKHTVPTVPEPEEWALIIVTLLVLLWSHFDKKRKEEPCCAAC